MKAIITLLVMLLMSHDVTAADLKPFLVLSVGESLDTLTIYQGIKGARCVEGNSNLGRYPSGTKLVVWTIIPVGTTALASWVFSRSNSRAVRIIGKALSYGAGSWGSYHAVQNVRHCGF